MKAVRGIRFVERQAIALQRPALRHVRSQDLRPLVEVQGLAVEGELARGEEGEASEHEAIPALGSGPQSTDDLLQLRHRLEPLEEINRLLMRRIGVKEDAAHFLVHAMDEFGNQFNARLQPDGLELPQESPEAGSEIGIDAAGNVEPVNGLIGICHAQDIPMANQIKQDRIQLGLIDLVLFEHGQDFLLRRPVLVEAVQGDRGEGGGLRSVEQGRIRCQVADEKLRDVLVHEGGGYEVVPFLAIVLLLPLLLKFLIDERLEAHSHPRKGAKGT